MAKKATFFVKKDTKKIYHTLLNPFSKCFGYFSQSIKHINSIPQLACLCKMTFNAFLTIWDEYLEYYYWYFFIWESRTKKSRKLRTLSSAGLKCYFSLIYGFLEAFCKMFKYFFCLIIKVTVMRIEKELIMIAYLFQKYPLNFTLKLFIILL